MRTLKLHFPDDALPALDTFLKKTKEARVFRRVQAVRDVVKGQRLQTVSDTLHFTYKSLSGGLPASAGRGKKGLPHKRQFPMPLPRGRQTLSVR